MEKKYHQTKKKIIDKSHRPKQSKHSLSLSLSFLFF